MIGHDYIPNSGQILAQLFGPDRMTPRRRAFFQKKISTTTNWDENETPYCMRYLPEPTFSLTIVHRMQAERV
jgi:hypothetical protein